MNCRTFCQNLCTRKKKSYHQKLPQPVVCLWQGISKSSDSDEQVSYRYQNLFGCVLHFLVCSTHIAGIADFYDPSKTCLNPAVCLLCLSRFHEMDSGFSTNCTEIFLDLIHFLASQYRSRNNVLF